MGWEMGEAERVGVMAVLMYISMLDIICALLLRNMRISFSPQFLIIFILLVLHYSD
jgi:hypothetical protein